MRDAVVLLRDAARVYDDPVHALDRRARGAVLDFGGGAEWMRVAVGALRGRTPHGQASFGRLGVRKYAACALSALVPVALAWGTGSPWWLLAAVPAFYAVEASFVFVFPAALDGAARPFVASWILVTRSCGVPRAMLRVLVLAAAMLLGGFAGRGFLRSWCLGCLAVLLWYERACATVSHDAPTQTAPA